MNWDIIVNRIRLEVRRVLRNRADPRMGRITSYDPAAHAVKVAILPEADFPLNSGEVDETGWIPLAPLCAGNGWGIYAPPAIGTQVMVNHSESHAGAGVTISSINDATNPAPNVPAGEFWLVHQSGTSLKLTNDTNASVDVQGSLTINVVNGDANVSVKGDANITAQGQANLLSAARVNLGAIGGKKVARDGDPVSTGGTIQATTSTVFSA